jgi:tetratricopeptide (TPR) repeat protein
MDRTEEALALLNETIQANPSEGLYRLRGIIHRAEGKEDEAVADFSKAIAMQPKDPVSLLQRAEISLGRGDVHAQPAHLDVVVPDAQLDSSRAPSWRSERGTGPAEPA